MAEPYTIRIFVPDGDPEGTKVVELLNWTGIGVAFPRSAWPSVSTREDMSLAGVYVLTGTAEGTDDELPTVYVGQGDEVRARIETHYSNKVFWDWGYAFVSKNLNRAHTTWLEHELIDRAARAGRSHSDNKNSGSEPTLSESDRADTKGFLREVLRILPLLGVRVFEKPATVATPGEGKAAPAGIVDDRDTVIVPAREEGFKNVFLGENCWYAIRISGGMLPKIKFIAAYQSAPVSAITYYAPVKRIEAYGDEGKYRLVFSEPAKPLPRPIPFGDAALGTMQSPRYTTVSKLLAAKKVADLVAA